VCTGAAVGDLGAALEEGLELRLLVDPAIISSDAEDDRGRFVPMALAEEGIAFAVGSRTFFSSTVLLRTGVACWAGGSGGLDLGISPASSLVRSSCLLKLSVASSS
jgi:hypothetical protein